MFTVEYFKNTENQNVKKKKITFNSTTQICTFCLCLSLFLDIDMSLSPSIERNTHIITYTCFPPLKI